MINKLLNPKILKIISIFVFLFFSFVFLFSRSFVGISFFGFRIGELSMLFSILSMVFFIFLNYKSNIYSKFLSSRFVLTNILFLISFFVVTLINQGSFLSTYTFKSSSYIWSIGFLYLGILIFKDISVSRRIPYLIGIYLIYLYIYAVLDFPQSVMDFFLSISDKYEPHKGSDILIMTLVPLYFVNRFFEDRRLSLNYCLFYSALFLPLLLYKSRGAFIAFLLFLILEIYNLKDSFNVSLPKNTFLIIFSVFIFILSSYIVTERDVQVDSVGSTVTELATYRIPDTEKEFVPIFFSDGRIYSSDSNLNWRFQIWQDVIEDMQEKNIFFTGYGFNEKIPAMNDPLRAGDDGLNENIHNFLLNVFARGGVFHFIIYVFLFLFLILKLKSIHGNYSFLSLIIPILLASFFDASMENAHFPLIFYFSLGAISYKDIFLDNRI